MADLVTLAEWKALTGVTSTDSTRDAALEAWIDAVSADIQGRLGRQFGTGSQTHIVDGPPSDTLLAPTGPFTISTLRVWVHDGARGDSSLFETADELTLYDGFRPEPDLDTPTVCTSRKIYRLGAVWGYEAAREVNRLAGYVAPGSGNVQLTYTLADSVPADVKAAAANAVTILYNGRTVGGVLTSESRGNYSYSRASGGGEAVADAVSAVMPTLQKYQRTERLIGWPTRGK